MRTNVRPRDTRNSTWTGYHQFPHGGSFEVFQFDPTTEQAYGVREPGFYWWACFPGCLPDGEAAGPFPTAEGAYLDAIEE